MKSITFKAMLLMVIALALSACGGSSSDGGGSTPPSTGATLGGNAVKGIIKNGLVKAEECRGVPP